MSLEYAGENAAKESSILSQRSHKILMRNYSFRLLYVNMAEVQPGALVKELEDQQ